LGSLVFKLEIQLVAAPSRPLAGTPVRVAAALRARLGHGYRGAEFRADLIAGLTVGVRIATSHHVFAFDMVVHVRCHHAIATA
jgi:hypothetical protein